MTGPPQHLTRPASATPSHDGVSTLTTTASDYPPHGTSTWDELYAARREDGLGPDPLPNAVMEEEGGSPPLRDPAAGRRRRRAFVMGVAALAVLLAALGMAALLLSREGSAVPSPSDAVAGAEASANVGSEDPSAGDAGAAPGDGAGASAPDAAAPPGAPPGDAATAPSPASASSRGGPFSSSEDVATSLPPSAATSPPAQTPSTGAPTTAQPTRTPSPPPTEAREPTAAPSPPPTTARPTSARPTTGQPSFRPSPRPVTEPPTANEEPAASGPLSEPAEVTVSRLTIELQTDRHGEETSWTFHAVDVTTNALGDLLAAVEENTYAPFEQDLVELLLPPGKYRLTLRDAFGDGFCCSNGSAGWYVLKVDGREVVRGGQYRTERTIDVRVGFIPVLSDRDAEWLRAHNVRRRDWHARHARAYVPLRWTPSLAAGAAAWADTLLADCEAPGVEHEPGVAAGENLAKNKGDAERGMGMLYPADYILRRWVDREESWGYPRNAHLTQALWRASRYVGCGDAARTYDDGAICRVQVCRYATAGNCAMAKFNATEGDNWLVPMLQDYSRCGPDCPSEGCF